MAVERILLTGATGMLGRHVLKLLKKKQEVDLYAVGRSEKPGLKNYITADISDTAGLNEILDKLKPDCVINCAAETNVNLCESDKERVYRLHVDVSAAIASKAYIRKPVYISTDSVFDGQRGNYAESDVKNPLNYYAKTKSWGEDAVLKGRHPAIIIRTNIIGFSEPLRSSLFEWGYKNLMQQNPISGFTDVIFNPLYVGTLAEILVNAFIFKDINAGVYNLGASDYNSKYDFLKMVASVFDFDDDLISPMIAGNNANALRPLNTTLNTGKAARELNIGFPTLYQELVRIQQDLNKIV